MGTASKIAAVLIAGAALVAEAAPDRPPEAIVRQRCQKCHGLDGRSSDPDYPKLAGQNADYLTRQLANFKTGVRHSKLMEPRVADLSGGEMRALALYFSAKTLEPAPAADPALVERGRRIYFAGSPANSVTACTTCHGPEGRGALYLPRLAGQHPQYLARQLRAFRDYSRKSPNMVMHTVVENITDPEIDAVAQFLGAME